MTCNLLIVFQKSQHFKENSQNLSVHQLNPLDHAKQSQNQANVLVAQDDLTSSRMSGEAFTRNKHQRETPQAADLTCKNIITVKRSNAHNTKITC